jgi:hypothetical protein
LTRRDVIDEIFARGKALDPRCDVIARTARVRVLSEYPEPVHNGIDQPVGNGRASPLRPKEEHFIQVALSGVRNLKELRLPFRNPVSRFRPRAFMPAANLWSPARPS